MRRKYNDETGSILGHTMKSKKLFLIGVGMTCLTLGFGEVVARYWLGLGTPPLSITHPKIEYMFKPNQDLQRFGNHQIYNEIGMRSAEMATLPQKRQILVFGDSVLNGGNLTDHGDLATTRATTKDVFFGNVSAGSWGPQNIGAWIDEFGFQGADAAVLVLSSHDLGDLPTFEPLNPNTHPTAQPMSALLEGFSRYLPRFLPNWLRAPLLEKTIQARSSISPPIQHEEGLKQVQLLIDRMADSTVATCLVLHRTQTELNGEEKIGSEILAAAFVQRGIPLIDDGAALLEVIKGGGGRHIGITST